MKINIANRRRAASQTRYKTTYEPIYSHHAWSVGEGGPTPTDTPDAFHAVATAVGPSGHHLQRPGKVSSRKKPHEALSIGKLTKRLQGAGVRGSVARSLAREIHAGPQQSASSWAASGGTVVLGWPLAELERRFGHRITRAISQFVSKKLLLIDEAWSLLADDDRLRNHIIGQYRRFHPSTFTVVQIASQLEKAEAR